MAAEDEANRAAYMLFSEILQHLPAEEKVWLLNRLHEQDVLDDLRFSMVFASDPGSGQRVVGLVAAVAEGDPPNGRASALYFNGQRFVSADD